MATQHSNTADAWTPEDFGKVLNKAIQAQSTAFRAGSLFGTDKVRVSFPLWSSDPSAAWLDELEVIVPTDGATGSVTSTPSKVGGITTLSNEIRNDTDPAIADQAAAGLANDIAKKIDAAFLANTTAKANSGLLSLTSSVVDTGATIANEDPFIDAIFAAEAVGANIDRWIMHPDTAKVLSKIKKGTGSNERLLERTTDGAFIAGIRVLTDPAVDANTKAWGLDSTRTKIVLRQGTEMRMFDVPRQDAIDVRGIARVGFAFLHPQSVVRLHDAA
ncbi:phage major capsid protein [Mycolicibacterium komossense]|uniref:Phage major capsid protein n=1 Tax=Mycolicibacterium komossense TaxID=1779 RepID=A0ABT3C4P7_9MYCO|nr:phage major capsid protein [Mycolicibacterium komossense]MCV7224448.1 phage major capsid protein [Mycolicibacterium komossense]